MRNIVIRTKNSSSNLSSPKGFTLIELLVVIAIIAALSIIGIAALVAYSRAQVLNASASDIATLLNAAKSRAQSQVKPTTGVCSTSPLDSYQVSLSIASKTYQLNAVCAGNTMLIGQAKTLPTDISFDSGGTTTTAISFLIITGGVKGAGDIKISGYSNSKKITVNSSGNITVQ